MNRRMIIVAAACAVLPLAEVRASALADLIRARIQDQTSSQQPVIVTIGDDTPQRATGWTPSDSSDTDPLVTKTRIGSDDARSGTSADQPVQQPVDSTTTGIQNANSGTGTSGLSRQDILDMSVDELMDLIRGAGSGSSSASGSGSSVQPGLQSSNGTPTFYELDRSNLLDMTGGDVASLIHQMAVSDVVVKRKQANRQQWLDYVDYLYTNPLAVVLPQDKSIDTLETDENKRWKLFLHDYGLQDISETGGLWRMSSVGTESVSSESAGAVSGALIDNKGDVVGTVQLKTSNVRQGSDGEAICDLTVQQTDLNGKRTVSKMKGVPVSEVTMGDQGLNAAFVPTTVGGVLPAGEKFFCVDFTDGFGQLNVITDLLPMAEPIHCDAKGKWKFDKAAKVKFVKGKDGAYSLTIDNLKGKTNMSKLKLTYKPKTGVFKGSFKLYSIGGKPARPKLVTKTVKVSGLVVNGIGSGTAKVSGTDIVWPVFIFD